MRNSEAAPTAPLNAVMQPQDLSMSNQLYYMLVMIYKAGALTRFVNAGPCEGAAAWRALVMHHEPMSMTRSAGLLQEVLAYDFEGDISGKLVAFGRDIHLYKTSSQVTFPDNIMVGTLLRRLPEGPMRQHLILNSGRLTSWALMKDEAENLKRAQLATSSGPSPMDIGVVEDVNALQQGKGKGSNGFRKGGGAKGSAPDSPCLICGKMGHRKRDCWYNEKNQQGSKANEKGKPHKSGKSVRKCWSCGENGHLAASCKKGGNVNALQEPASEDTLSGLYLASAGVVVGTEPAGAKISFGLDSGAAVTTVPKQWRQDYPAEANGVYKGYRLASGEEIADLGMRRLMVVADGSVRGVMARVTKVSRADGCLRYVRSRPQGRLRLG